MNGRSQKWVLVAGMIYFHPFPKGSYYPITGIRLESGGLGRDTLVEHICLVSGWCCRIFHRSFHRKVSALNSRCGTGTIINTLITLLLRRKKRTQQKCFLIKLVKAGRVDGASLASPSLLTLGVILVRRACHENGVVADINKWKPRIALGAMPDFFLFYESTRVIFGSFFDQSDSSSISKTNFVLWFNKKKSKKKKIFVSSGNCADLYTKFLFRYIFFFLALFVDLIFRSFYSSLRANRIGPNPDGFVN